MQRRYGIRTLDSMCDRLADALEASLRNPDHPGTDMEKYLAREYARELRAKAYPVAKGRLNTEGTARDNTRALLAGDVGNPPNQFSQGPSPEAPSPKGWTSDQDYPPDERGSQIRIPSGPWPVEKAEFPGGRYPPRDQA
eukprot:490221-Heterocapsa_arctica.AAC.1